MVHVYANENEVTNKTPNAIKHICYCGKEYIYLFDLMYRGE